MEKGVDQGSGVRQRYKGMRWRPAGCKALDILKVVARHDQSEQLWFPQGCGISSEKFTGRIFLGC
jgi:hypothetical protein